LIKTNKKNQKAFQVLLAHVLRIPTQKAIHAALQIRDQIAIRLQAQIIPILVPIRVPVNPFQDPLLKILRAEILIMIMITIILIMISTMILIKLKIQIGLSGIKKIRKIPKKEKEESILQTEILTNTMN
jgi:hypothetical protein